MSYVLETIPGSGSILLPLIIVELVLVLVLSWAINKISTAVASVLFVLYSLITGATLSVVLLAYTGASVLLTFIIAASVFGFMSVYGYFTKTDLTSFGKIMIMGLFGIIIASIANYFIGSTMTDYVISWVGVVLFTGLTAYDTQKLKNIGDASLDGETKSKAAILGALTLYLDFINLFLKLLSLFGKRR